MSRTNTLKNVLPNASKQWRVTLVTLQETVAQTQPMVTHIQCLFTDAVQFDSENIIAVSMDDQLSAVMADVLRSELQRNADKVSRPSTTVYNTIHSYQSQASDRHPKNPHCILLG